jgi:cell wall-associated NlpC family hydrolase
LFSHADFNLILPTTFPSFLCIRHVCASALLMCACAIPGSAMAADITDPPMNVALAKLQDFGSRASELAMNAFGLIGIKYRMGGNTPENGLDCSGLVQYVFKQAWGATLPRTAEEISRVGEKVESRELQPGDLVFYNTLRRGFSHVGIYLGDNKFIHSPSAGGQVRVESMEIGYWKSRFNGARRITAPEHQ